MASRVPDGEAVEGDKKGVEEEGGKDGRWEGGREGASSWKLESSRNVLLLRNRNRMRHEITAYGSLVGLAKPVADILREKTEAGGASSWSVQGV